MKKIAIIPARSGSKGLKDKNIINLNGKPLIAYTIEAALNSQEFEDVIVSTDSNKYGQISKDYGASVDIRKEELASDTATTFDVLKDLLERYDKPFDYFVLLQPTSPLRNAKHIQEAIQLFENNYEDFDFLVSIKEAEHTSLLVKPLGKKNSLEYFDTDFANYRRQNSKEYSPNGAIFVGKTKQYLNKGHFFGSKSIAYIMNKEDSIDIDDNIDYILASALMEKKNEEK